MALTPDELLETLQQATTQQRLEMLRLITTLPYPDPTRNVIYGIPCPACPEGPTYRKLPYHETESDLDLLRKFCDLDLNVKPTNGPVNPPVLHG